MARSGLDPNPIQPYFYFLIDAHLTCGSRSSAVLDRKVFYFPFTFKLPYLLIFFFPFFCQFNRVSQELFPSMSLCVWYQNYFRRKRCGTENCTLTSIFPIVVTFISIYGSWHEQIESLHKCTYYYHHMYHVYYFFALAHALGMTYYFYSGKPLFSQ